jgi:hypothetical protein
MYAVDGNTIHVVMNALVVGGNQCGQKYISDVSTLFEEKQRKHDNEWLHQMTIDKLIKKIRPCERACIIIVLSPAEFLYQVALFSRKVTQRGVVAQKGRPMADDAKGHFYGFFSPLSDRF